MRNIEIGTRIFAQKEFNYKGIQRRLLNNKIPIIIKNNQLYIIDNLLDY